MNPHMKQMIDVSGGDFIYFYPPEVGQKVPNFLYMLAGYVLISGLVGANLIIRNKDQ